jgi:glycolate oxidase FAD binding subunit
MDFSKGPGSNRGSLAVRFQSFEGSVRRQAGHAAQLMGVGARIIAGDDDKRLWAGTGAVTNTKENDVLARLISTPTDLPDLLESAQNVALISGVDLTLRAHMGHGHALLRWHDPSAESALAMLKQLRREAEVRGGNLVIWRAPAETRTQMDVWGDPGEGIELMRRVKAQFDPNGILNPGRFVGGI